jgi:hypothetical protein
MLNREFCVRGSFGKKSPTLIHPPSKCGDVSNKVDKSKEEKQMVLIILSKLGPEFFMFVSRFHSVKFSSGATWRMPYLENFIESLIKEKTKIINMGKIKGPKVHALIVQYRSHQYQKYKD